MNNLARVFADVETKRRRELRHAGWASILMLVFWSSTYSSVMWMILVDALGRMPKTCFSGLMGLSMCAGIGMGGLFYACLRRQINANALRTKVELLNQSESPLTGPPPIDGRSTTLGPPAPHFCPRCGTSLEPAIDRRTS